MGKFAVILPAAGRSTRFGDPKQKKIYAELEGRAVWLRAVEPFVNRDDVAQIVIAIAAEDRELFERRYRASVAFMNIKVIEGGRERCDTVARALEIVDPDCEFIAVHDAARPCVSTPADRRGVRGGTRARRRPAGDSGIRNDQAGRRMGARRARRSRARASTWLRRRRPSSEACSARRTPSDRGSWGTSPTTASSSRRSAIAAPSCRARRSTSRSPRRWI